MKIVNLVRLWSCDHVFSKYVVYWVVQMTSAFDIETILLDGGEKAQNILKEGK